MCVVIHVNAIKRRYLTNNTHPVTHYSKTSANATTRTTSTTTTTTKATTTTKTRRIGLFKDLDNQTAKLFASINHLLPFKEHKIVFIYSAKLTHYARKKVLTTQFHCRTHMSNY